MKSINESELQKRFSEILDAAQRQPIVVRRDGKDVAAVVSIADYERLRALHVQDFLYLRREVAEEAVAAKLTPEKLSKLITDPD